MEFNIYDIYVDASINLEQKLGCAGMALVDRKRDTMVDSRYLVKPNATNNMCEIIAIWMGIYRAIELLYFESLPFHVNIFSDSQISLFGMREWLPSWIRKRNGNVLINSSGAVSNQIWYEDAYHAIISSGIKIKFFHQKGHVDENRQLSLFAAEKAFRTSNNMTPHMAGTSPAILAKYNNFVDTTSRDIIIGLLSGKNITEFPGARYMLEIPLRFDFIDSDISKYESQIHGGLNYPLLWRNA